MKTKLCTKCKRTLPLTAESFHRRSGTKSGFMSHCRECRAEYERGRKNDPEHLEGKRRNRKKRRKVSLAFYYSSLEDQVCTDCGCDQQAVLEFDHIEKDKKSGLYQMASSGVNPKILAQEMDKCEIVCRNCHRVRTITRIARQSSIVHYEKYISCLLSDGVSAYFHETSSWYKKGYVSLLKEISFCVDCKTSVSSVLEFDHVRGEKVESIAHISSYKEFTLLDLLQEINKCEVRCCNCHKLVHIEREYDIKS